MLSLMDLLTSLRRPQTVEAMSIAKKLKAYASFETIFQPKLEIRRKIMITKKVLLLTLLLSTLAFTNPAIAAENPAPQSIAEDMSCGVCGMYPAKFVKWQSQVIFTDNKMVPFDGCKDMFKYILNMAKFDQEHTEKDIAAIWVKDYNSGKWLDGRAVSYVVGSSEMGPMGKELIPFANPVEALSFKKEKSGMIMNYDDVTMDDIKKLGGMKMNGKKMKM
jgi:copper chaperone NosL